MRAKLVLVVALALGACTFSSSALIGDLIVDNGGVETCGPIWADADDPVNLVNVLSYGPPSQIDTSLNGSTVRWEEVHYTSTTPMNIDTYLLRAVGIDEYSQLRSSTYLGGVVEYEAMADVIESYGQLLPTQYVSESGEGVILLAVARLAAAPDDGVATYQPTKVDFSVDGVAGSVTPPERIGTVDFVGVAETDPDSVSYCGH